MRDERIGVPGGECVAYHCAADEPLGHTRATVPDQFGNAFGTLIRVVNYTPFKEKYYYRREEEKVKRAGGREQQLHLYKHVCVHA